MGFIHKWIMQITAVILIGSVCELIMPEGNIKKYINPVLGFLLILVIINPITGIDAEQIRLDLLTESSDISGDIVTATDKMTEQNILDIYTERLSDKIEQKIRNTYRIGSEVTLSVSDQAKSFGDIKRINVVLLMQEGDFVNTGAVSKALEEEFGVDNECIDISTEVIH